MLFTCITISNWFFPQFLIAFSIVIVANERKIVCLIHHTLNILFILLIRFYLLILLHLLHLGECLLGVLWFHFLIWADFSQNSGSTVTLKFAFIRGLVSDVASCIPCHSFLVFIFKEILQKQCKVNSVILALSKKENDQFPFNIDNFCLMLLVQN